MKKRDRRGAGGLLQLSELPLFKEIAKDLQTTPSAAELIEIGTGIQQQPAKIDNAAYMHVVLCHLGMPRSPKQQRVFERHYERPNFRYALRMEAGVLWDGRQFAEHPLPAGTKPRRAASNSIKVEIVSPKRIDVLPKKRRDVAL